MRRAEERPTDYLVLLNVEFAQVKQMCRFDKYVKRALFKRSTTKRDPLAISTYIEYQVCAGTAHLSKEANIGKEAWNREILSSRRCINMSTEFFIQGKSSTKERPVDYLELPNVEFAQARPTCQKSPIYRDRDVPKRDLLTIKDNRMSSSRSRRHLYLCETCQRV